MLKSHNPIRTQIRKQIHPHSLLECITPKVDGVSINSAWRNVEAYRPTFDMFQKHHSIVLRIQVEIYKGYTSHV